jgi:hypothetical protein
MKSIGLFFLVVLGLVVSGCNQTPMPTANVSQQESNPVKVCNAKVTTQADAVQPGSTLPTDPLPGESGGGGKC